MYKILLFFLFGINLLFAKDLKVYSRWTFSNCMYVYQGIAEIKILTNKNLSHVSVYFRNTWNRTPFKSNIYNVSITNGIGLLKVESMSTAKNFLWRKMFLELEGSSYSWDIGRNFNEACAVHGQTKHPFHFRKQI